jgi:hypothetical protein
MEAQVTHTNLLGMQVCVPKDWTDEQVELFANTVNPTGIESKWQIRRQGDPLLNGCDERVQCDERESCCHVMLDC